MMVALTGCPHAVRKCRVQSITMADIDWIILSERSIREQGTNTLSIIGIIDGSIRAQQIPFRFPKLCVNLRLIGNPDEYVIVTLRVIQPDGTQLYSLDASATFGSNGVLTDYFAFKDRWVRSRLDVSSCTAMKANKSARCLILYRPDCIWCATLSDRKVEKPYPSHILNGPDKGLHFYLPL
jgi:Family of unknown function (DUF6941)